ncbi:putative exopolysaccharide production protein, exoQ [Aurantimonas manganoxydans SI85-9A1]|uniref:Putative exopolysaccharide production protein, exoQ n=1 Tax=Aurantimonas manganoxydans (strain ATCC BAA-1229 / DSM 21871 / SI85-9A1) TaxID=287752 RepID=Q1YH89_AURMS|nr:O-antigen ligase [Aurantimonas manganoxydans]EAS49690.1 putative exopolysaccharide production protein, exoQ [Aurantimonas manganoxydans SI85-9A1]
MSSIAVQNRTDFRSFGDTQWWTDTVRMLLGAGIFTALLVTVTPFAVTFTGDQDAGSLANQLGYASLALVVFAGHALFTDRTTLLAMARPMWIIMAAWLLVSALWADSPENALRGAAFTLLAIATVSAILCFPKDVRAFRTALTLAMLAVLALSYFGVIAMPGLALHDGSGSEPQHAGLWRGAYSHKNVAGAVFAVVFFCGVYLFRCGQRWSGFVIALLAAFFVLKTGSKTSITLLPLVAAIVIIGSLTGRWLLTIGIALTLTVMAFLTIGTVLSPLFDQIVQTVVPGTTFTGRMDLWRFALEVFEGHEWTGFGLNAFWQSQVVYGTERNFELSWDPRGSPNAHNGYLDIAISMGLPGLVLAVIVLVVLPLWDFTRVGRDRESQRLGQLFLMVLAYLLLNAFLESFLFDRANPIWMAVCFAVIGLRLLSRHSVRA